VRYQLTPVRIPMIKKKRQEKGSAGEDEEKREHLL
jgi:hypothetical protein